MSTFGDSTFSQEQHAKYEELLGVFLRILADSDMIKLEYLAFQLTDIVERKLIVLPDDEIGRFVLEMIAKAVNEAWGLIGSLRHGAFTSCFHHARAVIELYAAFVYVFSNPKKQKKRAEKFHRYHSVYTYNHYKSLRNSLERGAITEEVFRDLCLVSDERFEELEQEAPALARLYSVGDDELHDVQNWHHPARISNLLEAVYDQTRKQRAEAEDGAVTEGADLDNLSKLYSQFSEMTHPSPLTARVTRSSFMLGPPEVNRGQINYDALNEPISFTVMMLTGIVLLLEDKMDIDIDII